jgi:hypothetical protein
MNGHFAYGHARKLYLKTIQDIYHNADGAAELDAQIHPSYGAYSSPNPSFVYNPWQEQQSI